MIKGAQEIIDGLNKEGGRWISADGFHTLTKVEKSKDGITFHPNAGVIIKMFVNTETGEVKLYLGKVFDESF